MAESSPPSYPVTSDGYDVYGEIGSGAFATVYHGRVRQTGEEVAIKVIDLDLFNTDWLEIRREISTMSLLNHPNVVSINCSFVDHQDLWIIMPLLQAGSCASIMKQIAPQGMKDEALLATILYFTLQGLQYLHKDGRIHRDVKAGNILIGAGGEVQLADFGVAGTLMENGDRKKNRQTFTGTPCWMAPEVMEQAGGYDEKADIWSFGITALELAYGYAPYAKFQPMKVMLLTLQEEPPTADIYKDTSNTFSKHFHSLVEKVSLAAEASAAPPADVPAVPHATSVSPGAHPSPSPSALPFPLQCLRKSPGLRPSARKLLSHRFFRGVKGKEYVQEQIVRKMPKPKRATEVQGIHKKKSQASSNDPARPGPGLPRPAGDDVGGVSVGSWVFDPEEFQEMKRAILEAEAKEGGQGGKKPRKVETVEEGGEDDEADYTPTGSPHLSPAHLPTVASALGALPPPALPLGVSAAASSLSAAQGNARKQSHGRFLVTDHVLGEAQSGGGGGLPYPTDGGAGGGVGQGGGDLMSAYQAMAAGQAAPMVSHSRVGRFAVTDEQHL